MILVLHAIVAARAGTMVNAYLIDQGQRRSGAAINFNSVFLGQGTSRSDPRWYNLQLYCYHITYFLLYIS